ncbi:2-hydroxymuconate tautomerase family protein [Vagococcus sp. PNs007]|uniref:Tautomerase n=1 Tax=Vagococcus proximus TaxID=2991417 RepID=A0ABT5X3G1_9ENTE|nr:2-hydroxymuconate tautomerase [Vagococcus proximus]MDF0480454.1 2-hydroxymuconate tautomerase family protein [Vagococcus proximus]
MPIVNVQLLEGRTPEQKKAMVKEVTDAIVRTTGAKKEAISIVITDMKKEDYGINGETLA